MFFVRALQLLVTAFHRTEPLNATLLFQWKGAGALKRFDSTSEEDAKINVEVADEIVDNPVLTKWYGTFPILPIGEHGVFTINRTKAKMLLGRKLSQQRKPSAYKRKVNIFYSAASRHNTKHFLMIPSSISLGYTVG